MVSRRERPTQADRLTALTASRSHQAQALERRLACERRRLASLDGVVRELQSCVGEARRAVGGEQAACVRSSALAAARATASARHGKLLVRRNTAAARARTLRQEVDALRLERCALEAARRTLDADVEAKRRGMEHVLSVARGAHAAREAAEAEVARCAAVAEKERAASDAACRDAQRRCEQQRRCAREAGREAEACGARAAAAAGAGAQTDTAAACAAAPDPCAQLAQQLALCCSRLQVGGAAELAQRFGELEGRAPRLVAQAQALRAELDAEERLAGALRMQLERTKACGRAAYARRRDALKSQQSRLTAAEAAARRMQHRSRDAHACLRALRSGVVRLAEALASQQDGVPCAAVGAACEGDDAQLGRALEAIEAAVGAMGAGVAQRGCAAAAARQEQPRRLPSTPPRCTPEQHAQPTELAAAHQPGLAQTQRRGEDEEDDAQPLTRAQLEVRAPVGSIVRSVTSPSVAPALAHPRSRCARCAGAGPAPPAARGGGGGVGSASTSRAQGSQDWGEPPH